MATANGNATAEAETACLPVSSSSLLLSTPFGASLRVAGGRKVVAPTYANTSGAAREFSGSGSFAALEQFYCRLKVCLRSLA